MGVPEATLRKKLKDREYSPPGGGEGTHLGEGRVGRRGVLTWGYTGRVGGEWEEETVLLGGVGREYSPGGTPGGWEGSTHPGMHGRCFVLPHADKCIRCRDVV